MDLQKTRIKLFVKKIKNKLPDAKVILFGSRARGESLLSSDVDLLVISDAFEQIPYIKRALLLLPHYTGTHHIDLLCYTQKEFQEKKKLMGVVQSASVQGIEL